MSYDIDANCGDLSISYRIGRENLWDRDYTYRVIEEYKKFCVLAKTAGHSVVPSEEVDKVWHAHLLYTEEYWENFCPQILGMRLHHGPTRNKSEVGKFVDGYELTLSSYRKLFGEPPVDIWLPSKERFATNYVMIDLNTHMVIDVKGFPRLTKIIKRILKCFG